MLIITLPTLTSLETLKLVEKIVSQPAVDAVRYNSGGDTVYTPKEILTFIKPIVDRYNKPLYVDLEGRQIRVAQWTPQSKGSVVLNHDFNLQLPAKAHFRRVGWLNIVNADPATRKIFLESRATNREYYFGQSQSVNIVAKNFTVIGYLNGKDGEFIKAAVELGLNKFMLSFAETENDITEFLNFYHTSSLAAPIPEIVLKIESIKGVQLAQAVKNFSTGLRLMAARDDLFLSFVNERVNFLEAIKTIIAIDPEAIVASKIMDGLNWFGELTAGDLADLVWLQQLGYRHFMWQDELTLNWELALQNWREIVLPLLRKEAKK